jgi:hypothetical protein
MDGRRATACDAAFVSAIVFLSFVAYVGQLGFYSDDWDLLAKMASARQLVRRHLRFHQCSFRRHEASPGVFAGFAAFWLGYAIFLTTRTFSSHPPGSAIARISGRQWESRSCS